MPRVVTLVSNEQLAERRRLELDKFDEMWDGVLHMTPPPDTEHGEFEGDLGSAIRGVLGERLPRPYIGMDVALADPLRWPNDFRVPDLLVCLAPDRDVREKYATRADLVIEIRSPDDETYDKFPFYDRRDVTEILVVDREASRIELHRLSRPGYESLGPDADGWLSSRLGVEFRWDRPTSCLHVRRAGEPGKGTAVPLVSRA